MDTILIMATRYALSTGYTSHIKEAYKALTREWDTLHSTSKQIIKADVIVHFEKTNESIEPWINILNK